MTIEDIRTLPVGQLADKNCILFFVGNIPVIREAFTVIDAWGFTYKTVAFCLGQAESKTLPLCFWGLGHWTRANAELCLLATKGSPKRQSARVHQIVIDTSGSPQQGNRMLSGIKSLHLQEMSRVLSCSPDKATPGWDVWGNEVDSSCFISIKEGFLWPMYLYPKT